MFQINDIDEHRVIHPASQTIARLPCRLQKTGIIRWVLLALGLAMVLLVVSPPAAAEIKEVDITCDESPIQVGFETIAADYTHCRKWESRGSDRRYGLPVESERFDRFATFEGGYINIEYDKAGLDTFFRPRKLKKSLTSDFTAVKSRASDWGPKIDVIVQRKIFITRSFMLRNDSCVGFVTRWGFAKGGNKHELVGYFCGADLDYRKEYIASFLSHIQITRPIPKAKHKARQKSPDAYRIAIFPGGGDFGSFSLGAVEERVARVLQINIQRDRTLTLAYSYYDDMLNAPRIKNPDRLWVGNVVRKNPNLELVYQMGRERDLDGVLMCWGVHSSSSWIRGTNPMWVYLIDVERRQVYQRKGTTAKSSVRKILKQVFSDFIDGRGGEPLQEAVRTGDLHAVKRLLAQGADVDAWTGTGITALHGAIIGGHTTIAELLIANGANLNTGDTSGYTPLHWAVHGGYSGLVEALLGRGAYTNARADDGTTPLHWAAGRGERALAELLIVNGANVDVRNDYDMTPLGVATVKGHKAMIDLLKRHGAKE